jgi:hypothetical protein
MAKSTSGNNPKPALTSRHSDLSLVAFVELHICNLNNSSLKRFVATGVERSRP